jgi:hypothetical protein
MSTELRRAVLIRFRKYRFNGTNRGQNLVEDQKRIPFVSYWVMKISFRSFTQTALNVNNVIKVNT